MFDLYRKVQTAERGLNLSCEIYVHELEVGRGVSRPGKKGKATKNSDLIDRIESGFLPDGVKGNYKLEFKLPLLYCAMTKRLVPTLKVLDIMEACTDVHHGIRTRVGLDQLF